ncbi:MAG TPA: Holliday junction resolvase RuvX, partial [Chloroflexota bacterium]
MTIDNTVASLRLLGLDVGDRRIGVAISDPMGVIASPVSVYRRTDDRRDADHIASLVQELEASGVVVGLPINMDGTEGPQAHKTRQFAHVLQQRGLEIRFWDERLSTMEATRLLTEQRHTRRKVRSRVDMTAAALILQSYLDRVRTIR